MNPKLPADSAASAATSPPTEPFNAAQGAALQRLALSRARLRVALMPPPETSGADGDGNWAPPRLLRQLWRHLRTAGRASPVVDLALGALQAWWFTRPWRSSLNGVRQNLETTVVPLVRRHPWAAVGVAAAAGAVVVVLRPWRWATLRSGWPLLRAGLVAQVVQQAAHWPWEAMLAAVMAGLSAAKETPREPAGGAGEAQADRD
jgi:hypothetical protein